MNDILGGKYVLLEMESATLIKISNFVSVWVVSLNTLDLALKSIFIHNNQ